MIAGVLSELGDPIVSAESITVSTAAVGLTTIPGQANACFISVETNGIRCWFDGTAPTASVGHAKDAGAEFTLYGNAMRKAKFIRSGGGDATIRVSYFAGL